MTALLTIFVPTEFHGTVFEEVATINGNRLPLTYRPRVHNGHVVVDASLGFFQRLLAGNHGKLWLEANPEAMAWLGEANRQDMFCNAFPGAHRAPPPTPAAPPPARMVRMRAPADINSCSVEGSELKIGADRTVTVNAAFAETLRSHGFVAA